jgi:hypothetical protein
LRSTHRRLNRFGTSKIAIREPYRASAAQRSHDSAT